MADGTDGDGTDHPSAEPPRHLRVAIVGSGFSGVGMGVALRETPSAAVRDAVEA